MQISGFIVLLVAVILSRILNERALRELSAEEKVRLLDGFANSRAYSLIPMVVFVGGYWLLMTKTDLNPQILTAAYFGILIAYIVVRTVLNQRKLQQLAMPAAYCQRFLISQVISLGGFAWFCFAMLTDQSSR